MKQKQKKGIWIHQRMGQDNEIAQWVTPLIVAMLACILLIFAMADLTGFSTICTPWIMAGTALSLCAIYGIVTKLNKVKWFYPAYLLVLFMLVVLLGETILSGFCIFWNQLGDAWTAANGWVIPELAVSDAPEKEMQCLLLFSIFMGSMIAAICCGLAQLEKQIFTVFLPILLFAGIIIFKQERAWVYIVPYLLFSICLLLWGRKEDEQVLVKATIYRWIPAVLCSVVLLAIASLSPFTNWAAGVGEAVQDKLHNARYETAYTTLPEGDFSDYSGSETQNHPALVVSLDQPEELYLRGFTGATFDEEVWKPLDGQILVEHENLLYWMNQQKWNVHGLFAEASALTGELESEPLQEVTIQNLNACGKYLYVPYTLCADTILEPEQISPDGVSAQGDDIYVYLITPGGAKQISQMLNHLKNSDTEETEAYLQAENAYRNFVFEHYMDIPEDVEEQLLPYWEKKEKEYGAVEKMSSEEKQECIRAFLEACFPENGEAPEIELPLDCVKGSSYQYATVAAMTLRYFGIPSRYAEGYVITKEMAENAENENSIQVGSSNGGAWVELYQSGLGWIPMQVMPGIENEPMGINLDAEDGEIPKEIPPKESLQENQPEPEEQPENGGGAVALIKENLSLSFILCLAILFVILLLIALRRRYILQKRGKRWEDTEAKKAVAWIYADSVDLLRRLGIARGNGSMKDLVPQIEEKFGEHYVNEFMKMTDINGLALFSSRPLEEEYRETAKAFYTDTLHLLLADAKWYKKLWMQWILCLY